MWKLLKLLLLGSWGPSTSARSLAKRLSVVEERLDYQQQQIRRLRGHVTGHIRHPDDDTSDAEDDGTFPEQEFQRLLAERRGVEYGGAEAGDDDYELPGL